MGRSGSLQLARVFGIRIGADYSWLIILFLAIFFAREQLSQLTNATEGQLYVGAVVMAFLFFASIIVHEIGHALAARQVGVEVAGIDLFLFGGLMHMKSEPRTPGHEFWVSVAGPLGTLLVIVVATIGGIVGYGADQFFDAVTLNTDTTLPMGTVIVSSIALINTLVLVFNLLPAYPLDGGRIARAAVWKVTGDRNRATRAAAGVGRYFGLLLVGLGVVLLVNGDEFNGIYLAFLGWLLSSQAKGVAMQTQFVERIVGVTVADLMDTEPVTIPAELSALRAYEDFFLRYQGWEWFAVVDYEDRFVGRAELEPIRAAAEGDASARPVKEFVEPPESASVATDATLDSLLTSEPLRRVGALIAVDGDGRLRGVVTADQVARALRTRLAPSSG